MKLCSIDDVAEASSKGFVIDRDHQVFVVKKDGEVFVYENRCPHLGIPLEMMQDQFLDCDKAFIQCSTHGALFEIGSGFCVAGPCSGASLQVPAFEIIDGDIYLKAQAAQ